MPSGVVVRGPFPSWCLRNLEKRLAFCWSEYAVSVFHFIGDRGAGGPDFLMMARFLKSCLEVWILLMRFLHCTLRRWVEALLTKAEDLLRAILFSAVFCCLKASMAAFLVSTSFCRSVVQ